MIIVGTTCQVAQVVDDSLTAQAAGSGMLPVFGTPFMLAMMENAALSALQPFLEEGQGSVGTFLDVRHNAPTPIGMKVTAEAEIYDVNDRTVMFKVRAWDESGPIGEGTHTRAIIHNEKFLSKCNAKLAK